MHENFTQVQYQFRKKFFNFLGAKFHIYNNSNQLMFFSKMKAFKLKEDITVFTDESMMQPLLSIKARQILDFGASYDVVDVSTNEKIGAMKRKGLKSIIRDEWIMMDPYDQDIALVQEDSGALAILRRMHELAGMFIPQKYNIKIGEEIVGTMNQNFNPFLYKLSIDFGPMQGRIDPRLGIAAAVLLGGIEGKQS